MPPTPNSLRATREDAGRGGLWTSTSTKDPALDDTFASSGWRRRRRSTPCPTTLLAFAEHGRVGDRLEADYARAEAVVAAVAADKADVDALGELLQRQSARTFSADCASLLEAMAAKTQVTGTGGRQA